MTEDKVYSSDLSYPKEEKKCLIYRIFGKSLLGFLYFSIHYFLVITFFLIKLDLWELGATKYFTIYLTIL